MRRGILPPMHAASGPGWVLVALFVGGCEGVAGVKDVRYEPADSVADSSTETSPGETGPAETGDAETDPAETGDADVGPLGTCPTEIQGSALVAVRDAKGGTFCIDATETTGKQYRAFVESATKPGPPPRCTGFVVAAKTYAADTMPQNNVLYCEAAIYCLWAGKRLCKQSEWTRTCGQGDLATTYPYGNTHVAGACVDNAAAAGPVGTTDCHGTSAPYDQVFDLSGNIDEWVDQCDDATTPPRCNLMGGYFGDTHTAADNYLTCTRPFAKGITEVDEIGIRCCADAK